MLISIILWSLAFPISTVLCYIPAHATNATQDAVAAGLNLTDTSTLLVKWSDDANGSYTQHIAYQLASEHSTGVNEVRPVIHLSFIGDSVNDDTPPTSTPWIALISCDTNSTNASPTKDIFTLAREKGAVAAIIYSSFSEACILHLSLSRSSPPQPPPPIDILASQSPTSSFLISSYLFAAHITPFSAPSSYSTSTSAALNASEGEIAHAISGETAYPPKGFLLARVRAWNVPDADDAKASVGAGGATSASASTSSTAAAAAGRKFIALPGIEAGVLIATCVFELHCYLPFPSLVIELTHYTE
ncbi:hypothetical protein CVT25_003225 [Psilocybe cyanescens]|uniref:PA domain-containing protein n=1 Tax=Psilocybe cyanescens TaxID=93625 RepID=A0A409WML0_PSICY|nr:hypothetical protein CVT25_003225 [Psilocybe cyanescens]